MLASRVVGKNGALIGIVHVDDTSLHKDELSNHVSNFDLDEWKRTADGMSSRDG
jgi:hypothetical protein